MTTIDITQISSSELEDLLAKKKKQEAKELEEERIRYERERDTDMDHIISLASEIEEKQKYLKTLVSNKMENHQIKLNEYGRIPGNSKGSFSIMNTEKTIRIKRLRDTKPLWDERSTKALELIHAFLYDTVKKRDQDLFEMLIGFLVKNKKGDLDYASVMNLLSHENRFNDNRWKEGLRLLRESYSSYLKGYQYCFERLNAEGRFEKIEVNFSAV